MLGPKCNWSIKQDSMTTDSATIVTRMVVLIHIAQSEQYTVSEKQMATNLVSCDDERRNQCQSCLYKLKDWHGDINSPILTMLQTRDSLFRYCRITNWQSIAIANLFETKPCS